MKPYLLFAGHNHYPKGGWEDFHSAHETEESALAEIRKHKNTNQTMAWGGLPCPFQWHQIIDIRLSTGLIKPSDAAAQMKHAVEEAFGGHGCGDPNCEICV